MLKSFLTVGLLQFATMLVLLVRTKTLAVLLGPENVGVMAVTDRLLLVITQTISLSFPFAALRFLPGAWSTSPGAYRALLRRMLVILAALALVATIGAVAITLFAPATWGTQLLPYRSIVVWATAAIPVLVFVPFAQNAIAGRMHEGRSMLFTLAHAGVFTLSAVVGAWWSGLRGVYTVYALLGPLVVLWGLGVALKGTKPSPAVPPPGPTHGWLGLPPALWRFSGTLMLLAFMAPYAALQVSYTVLSRLGAQTAGWMQAAVGLSLSVRALLGSAHPVFLTPNVNRGGTPAERLAWANTFQRTFLLLTLGLVPPLLLFSGLAVDILYSPAFSPGARFAVFFILAEVVNLIAGTYQALVLAFDHLAFHLFQNVVAQLTLAGLALLLIPRVGIAGAGIATLASPLFLVATTMLFLRRRYGLRVPGRLRALAATTVAALVVAGTAGALWPELTFASIAVKLAIYAASVAAGAAFLDEGERRRLWALATSWRRGAAGVAI